MTEVNPLEQASKTARAIFTSDISGHDRTTEFPVTELHHQIATAIDIVPDDLQMSRPPENFTRLGYDYGIPTFDRAKVTGQKPVVVAEQFESQLNASQIPSVDSVGRTGPYINFKLNRTYVTDSVLKRAVSEENPWLGTSRAGSNVVVEYSSPNVAKRMGLQHIPTTIAGEAIARTLEAAGGSVMRVNYPGDFGFSMGKLLAGWELYGDEKAFTEDPVGHINEIYVLMSDKSADADTKSRYNDMSRQALRRLEQGDPISVAVWNRLKAASSEENQTLYHELGIEFDIEIPESAYVQRGQKIVDQLITAGIVKLDDDGSAFDADTRQVLRKSDGGSLYLTRDLAAVEHRVGFGAHELTYIVGAEQTSHFAALASLAERSGILDDDTAIDHVKIGLLTTRGGGKISSREGKNTSFKEVFDAAVSRYRESHPNVSDDVAHAIGVGSVTYNVLSADLSKDSIIDPQVGSKEDDGSASYLQTTRARAHVLAMRAVETGGMEILSGDEAFQPETADEWEVIKNLLDTPTALTNAAANNSPHHIASQLAQTAKSYNRMYRGLPVIDENGEVNPTRAAISLAVSRSLRHGLELLLVETPDRI